MHFFFFFASFIVIQNTTCAEPHTRIPYNIQVPSRAFCCLSSHFSSCMLAPDKTPYVMYHTYAQRVSGTRRLFTHPTEADRAFSCTLNATLSFSTEVWGHHQRPGTQYKTHARFHPTCTSPFCSAALSANLGYRCERISLYILIRS